MKNPKWLDKPYYSLDAYCKEAYGEKSYKIALDAGFSCPNRDGHLSSGGCIFCSAGGSGDFAQKANVLTVKAQLQKGRERMSHKQIGNHFIAYFQAYTNTYGPVSYLKDIFTAALCQPDIIGISIATRPDCLGSDIIALLGDLQICYPDKFIWIELGLQTIHESTSDFINRGYSLSVFEKACLDLDTIGIPYIVHVILGLPYETPEMMFQTCRYLNHIPTAKAGLFLRPFGVKLQLLHILKGTALGDLYSLNKLPGFTALTQDDYTNLLIHCLEILHKDIVIHRLTGDGPKELLIAPLWSLNKRNVLNTLHKTMQQRNTFQGRCYYDAGTIDPL